VALCVFGSYIRREEEPQKGRTQDVDDLEENISGPSAGSSETMFHENVEDNEQVDDDWVVDNKGGTGRFKSLSTQRTLFAGGEKLLGRDPSLR